jgi:hypothetical protein
VLRTPRPTATSERAKPINPNAKSLSCTRPPNEALADPTMHIYRWDLDRTYLDSAIHGVRALLRSAWEPAAMKRTLPGASTLLRGLIASDPSAQVTILSGSPTQMRPVIEEKLRMDGVRVDKLILKDNLRNLKAGRLRAIREQIGYKLPILLEERAKVDACHRESLFGDDAESDALIYVAYADVIAGRLDAAGLDDVLKQGGAYPDQRQRAADAAGRLKLVDAVDHIFIRLDHGRPEQHFAPLGSRLTLVFHWLQAALVLHRDGRLRLPALEALLDETRLDLGPAAVEGLVADAVRRGLVRPEDLESTTAFVGLSPGIPRFALEAMAQTKPDYRLFLRSLKS